MKEEEAQQLAFELGAIGCVEVRLEILSEGKDDGADPPLGVLLISVMMVPVEQ